MATVLTKLFDPTSSEVTIVGTVLGTIERCYGLLRSEETLRVTAVFNRSGDLAVADRLAYVYAQRTHAQVLVFVIDGWYYVGTVDRPLSMEQAQALVPADDVRILSLVDERGIAPLVAPLVRGA